METSKIENQLAQKCLKMEKFNPIIIYETNSATTQ